MSIARSPGRPAAAGRAVVLLIPALLFFAPPAEALRIMNYNILNWSGTSGVGRVPHMGAIVRGVR